MILEHIDEATVAGARHSKAAELLGLDSRTLQRWRARGGGEDLREGPKTSPANTLSEVERARILEAVNSPEFRDLSPKQIVPTLADREQYLASESTIYRILREKQQLSHRESSRAPTRRHKPQEHVAIALTYLKSPLRGSFWYLYMVEDVWSRHQQRRRRPTLESGRCSRFGSRSG